jgi:membrane protein DedA with SNARE-associated domain
MHHVVASLPAVIQPVVPFLRQYGYFAVFFGVLLEDFGVPLPGETIVIAASILAAQHVFQLGDVIIFAALGGSVGDTIGFLLGRKYGHQLLLRFGRYVGLNRKVLEKFDAWIVHHGVWLIAVARFVDGFRQLNGWIAGANEIPWTSFVPLNILGAVLWAGAWAVAGYFFSHRILTVMARFQQFGEVIVGVAVLGIAIPVGLHLYHKYHANSQTPPDK